MAEDNALRRAGLTVLAGLGVNIGATFVLGKLIEGALHDTLSPVDHWITHRTPKNGKGVTNQAMRLASSLGEPFVLYPVVGLASLRCLAGQRPPDAVALGAALLGSAAIPNVVKLGVARPRPRFKIPLTKPSGSSFPSNHIMMSLATYGMIVYLATRAPAQEDPDTQEHPRTQRRRRLLWLPVLLLCALIAWSRIYQGVHRPTDVFAGWLAGTFWLLTCIRLHHALTDAEQEARNEE